jgi:hypothetical protein
VHTITAERGVDQGCRLGALLFTIATRGAAEASLKFAKEADSDAALLFYMDDGYLHVDPQHADILVDNLVAEFRKVGVELNLTKLQVRTPTALMGDALPPALQQYRVSELKCLGTKLAAPGDKTHEGLPTSLAPRNLGPDIERLQTLSRRLEELIVDGLPIHTAVSLLRVYAGPSAQHAMRATTVRIDSAEQYDREVAKAWSRLLKAPVDHENNRLWLPARLGGMGASSARHRAAPSAWSAWTLVLPDVLTHLGYQSPEELFLRIPSLARELGMLHKRLVDQGAPLSIAGSLVERAVGQPVRINRIMGYIYKREHGEGVFG